MTPCVLCSSLSEGQPPFGLAEGWAAVRDITGQWWAACPDHVESGSLGLDAHRRDHL